MSHPEAVSQLEENLREEVRLRRHLLEAEASLSDAVRNRSAADVLDARVEALRILSERTRSLALSRAPLVSGIAGGIGLPPDASLREICGRLSPEDAEALRTVREELRSILLDTQLRVRADAALLRQSLDLISMLVRILVGSATGTAGPGYESAGRPASASSGPVLFDADL